MVGSVVSGVFGMAAASKGAKAAKQAANLEAEVARENIALQREIYETGREDQKPYREMGYGALNRLGSSYGLRPETTTTTLYEQPDGSYAPGNPMEKQGTLAPMPGGAGGVRAFAQNSDVLERFRGVMDPAGFEHLKYLLDTGQDTSAYDAMIGLSPGTLASSAGRNAGVQQQAAPRTRQETSTRYVDDGSDPLDASQDQMRRLAAGFETSPGYQFRVQEGENALARAQGARGKLLSGEAMRELTQYGQGLASDEYGTYMNRATSAFGDYNNRLAALAGVGQSATQSGMQAGQQFGATAGNILSQSGSNQANALLAGGAIRAGGMSNIGQGLQNAYSNYQFNNALSNMGRGGGSSWANPDNNMILSNFRPVTGTAGGGNFWPG